MWASCLTALSANADVLFFKRLSGPGRGLGEVFGAVVARVAAVAVAVWGRAEVVLGGGFAK